MSDRERLRWLARGLVDSVNHDSYITPRPIDHMGTSALDAIALWTLLREPTCMLCGAERQYRKLMTPDSEYQYFIAGPDAGSVLCSKCREGK